MKSLHMSVEQWSRSPQLSMKERIRLAAFESFYSNDLEAYVEFLVRDYASKLNKAEEWATQDELPEADVSDLVAAYQYQSTIDADFES